MSNFLRFMSNRLSPLRHDGGVKRPPVRSASSLRVLGNSPYPHPTLTDGSNGSDAFGPLFLRSLCQTAETVSSAEINHVRCTERNPATARYSNSSVEEIRHAARWSALVHGRSAYRRHPDLDALFLTPEDDHDRSTRPVHTSFKPQGIRLPPVHAARTAHMAGRCSRADCSDHRFLRAVGRLMAGRPSSNRR